MWLPLLRLDGRERDVPILLLTIWQEGTSANVLILGYRT